MKPVSRFLIPAVVLVLSLTVSASPVRHFSLVKSSPVKDQKFDAAAAPTRLQLWFSEAPAAPASQIVLKRDAVDVALGKLIVVAKEKSIHTDPVKPLEPGAYTLTWRAAGDDGHVMSGDVKFSIVPKGTP